MEHEPIDGVLGWLDSPRLVVGAFAFFLCGLTILGILLWADQRQQQRDLIKQVARIDTIQQERKVQAAASNKEAVERCFASAASAPALQRILAALERETSDVEAKMDLLNYRRLSEQNTPTVRECRQLADKLNVSPPKGGG